MTPSRETRDRFLAALLVIALGCALSGAIAAPPGQMSDDEYVETVLYPATALLFKQDEGGSRVGSAFLDQTE